MTVSKPDGASSRAMSIALNGLSVSRIFGAIGPLLGGGFAGRIAGEGVVSQFSCVSAKVAIFTREKPMTANSPVPTTLCAWGWRGLVSAATIGCEFCRMVMRAACGAALDLSGRGRGSALGRTFVEAFRDALA